MLISFKKLLTPANAFVMFITDGFCGNNRCFNKDDFPGRNVPRRYHVSAHVGLELDLYCTGCGREEGVGLLDPELVRDHRQLLFLQYISLTQLCQIGQN